MLTLAEDVEEVIDQVVVLKMLEFLVVVLELIKLKLETETSLEPCNSGYVDVVDIERLPWKVLERVLECVLEELLKEVLEKVEKEDLSRWRCEIINICS